ncbi:hypothetical protein [Rhizobium rhizogenes]|uniref:hypothetical protein n=1 Tax=Rhizobium rhizogenes TaxID=359 RepID=UPI001573B675|nr:hypothetical protein [Rhizobium rhizogenes]NTG09252.1 hypothetical protein [Rhizobium rhizogenes]
MWIDLIGTDGNPVFVNFNQATHFRQSTMSSNTVITLSAQSGSDAKTIEVKEDLQTVANMITEEEKRLANLTKTAH